MTERHNASNQWRQTELNSTLGFLDRPLHLNRYAAIATPSSFTQHVYPNQLHSQSLGKTRIAEQIEGSLL
jgi:hypothetical protein